MTAPMIRSVLLLVLLIAPACNRASRGIATGKADLSKPQVHEVTLFTAGHGGYTCYRIPALVVSSKGTALAFCEARKHNCKDWDEINIVMRRSIDNGEHWDDMRVIASDGANSINQAAPVVDRDTGVIWLLHCKNNQQVYAIQSADEGTTWSKPVEITRQVKGPGWHYLGTGPGHGIQLKSGRLLIPSWGDTSPGPVTWRPEPNWDKVQFSYVIYSDDHGATWKRGQSLESDMSDECQVVEAADGRVYMNARSRQGKLRRAYAWSDDGGASWSKVKFDENLPEPSCEGSVLRFTDQEHGGKSRVLLSNPAVTTERSHLTVRVSYDECRTWPVSNVLHAGESGYSDLATARDMSILCLYDADHYTKLLLDRFSIEWLTNGKDHLAPASGQSIAER
jgi:sialidase-1